MAETASLALACVLKHLTRHSASTHASRPLFVGLQGPQGSGKSYLADVLQKTLTASPHSLRVAQLSLDDLYLGHAALQDVGARNPLNELLQGRGLPGTHDVALGTRTLAALGRSGPGIVDLPVYDKSAYGGKGDRAAQCRPVTIPLDVVIFEGWMLGFLPFRDPTRLREHYDRLPSDAHARSHAFEFIAQVDVLLEAYEDQLWPMLDLMITLRPQDPSFPWIWRLQQEHAMKAKNGGKGMSDEEVKAFVDRYAPAYDLWDFTLPAHAGRQSWQTDRLSILLDVKRECITES